MPQNKNCCWHLKFCTRAIKPGENFRAGRWWWEQNSGKECGLHETTSPDKEL